MRKLLSSGLVMFAGMVSAPSGVSTCQTIHRPAPDYRHDRRFGLLQRFFNRWECPARALSHVFLEAADDYDLDWRLLPSLSWVESTGGKQARHNNMFGWDSGRASFTSLSAGIHTVGYYLSKSDLYRDKSIDEILSTYNPDAEYARKVKSVMRQIAPGD